MHLMQRVLRRLSSLEMVEVVNCYPHCDLFRHKFGLDSGAKFAPWSVSVNGRPASIRGEAHVSSPAED